MNSYSDRCKASFRVIPNTAIIALCLLGTTSIAAPILQPGAPGEPTRELDAKTAVAIAESSYTAADVRFIQDMIVHHHQALMMCKLARQRTNNQEVLNVA